MHENEISVLPIPVFLLLKGKTGLSSIKSNLDQLHLQVNKTKADMSMSPDAGRILILQQDNK